MRITIKEIPPSLNRFQGRFNSWEYRNEKRRWTDTVSLLAKCMQNRTGEQFERARVELTYFFQDSRRRDPDNYSGKLILDGLTKAGVIADDDFDHIELVIKKGGVDKKNPRTEIEIKEVENGKES